MENSKAKRPIKVYVTFVIECDGILSTLKCSMGHPDSNIEAYQSLNNICRRTTDTIFPDIPLDQRCSPYLVVGNPFKRWLMKLVGWAKREKPKKPNSSDKATVPPKGGMHVV